MAGGSHSQLPSYDQHPECRPDTHAAATCLLWTGHSAIVFTGQATYAGALDEAVHCGPARAAARNAIDAIVQSTSQRCARVACSIQVHGVYATIAVRMNSCCFLLKLVYMPNIAIFPVTIDSLFSYFNIRVIAGVYCDLICSRSHIIFFRAVTLCVLHVQ